MDNYCFDVIDLSVAAVGGGGVLMEWPVSLASSVWFLSLICCCLQW